MPLPNLLVRVLFAVAAIPIVLAAFWAGGDPLALLLAAAAGLAAWECCRIAVAAGHAPFRGAAVALAALLPIAVRGYHTGAFAPPVIALAMMIVLGLLTAALFARSPGLRPLGAVAVTLLTIVYTGGTLSFGYALRYHNYVIEARAGALLVLYPVLLAWATDTAAYFAGKAFGRHKLMLAVSPGKTVEGAVAGLVFGMFVSWGYARWVLAPEANLLMLPGIALAVGAAISVAAQVGDLVESLLKREAGVKDSSQLIPGHGGVLDRLDSIFFVLPVAYFLFTFPHVLLPLVR